MYANWTAMVLRTTYAAMAGRAETMEDHIWHCYQSYYDGCGNNLIASTASRYVSGERHMSRPIIMDYIDPAHPACPVALEADLYSYLWGCKTASAVRRALQEILRRIPKEDRVELTVLIGADDGTNGYIARLWAVVLWYANCEDYAMASAV